MILHWEQLALYYGTNLNIHKWRFEKGHQTTFGLLCCRVSQGDDRLVSSGGGDHAEERLLRTSLWREDIPGILNDWTPQDSPIVVTIALNRSPCMGCTHELIRALGELHRRFPLRAAMIRFVLAMRGLFQGTGPQNLTLISDLRELSRVGWQLCVLQVGHQLSASGTELLENLQRIVGRGGFVRLG